MVQSEKRKLINDEETLTMCSMHACSPVIYRKQSTYIAMHKCIYIIVINGQEVISRENGHVTLFNQVEIEPFKI